MKKILIVEDVALNVELLVQLLEDRYELLIAGDGGEAIEQARLQRPDLILMDISLPVMDGYEATRRIKGDPALRATPIVGISAHAMRGDEQRASEAGCDDYLTKPIDDARLLALVARYLDERSG